MVLENNIHDYADLGDIVRLVGDNTFYTNLYMVIICEGEYGLLSLDNLRVYDKFTNLDDLNKNYVYYCGSKDVKITLGGV